MQKINKIYWKIMHLGTTRIRNLCDLRLYDEVRCEAEHLHQIPTLIDEEVLYPHLFYLNTHCTRFKNSMSGIATAASLDHINGIYKALWAQLREAIIEHFGVEET